MHEYLEDEFQVYKMGLWSPGPGCHGGCGAKVYLKDGMFAKVEGDEDHPFHQGRLCPRALALRQYIHHPNRLRYPLKRVGERGSGKWARISWDEALDTCEQKMRELRDEFGAESMVFGQGTGRDSGGPIIFLAYAYGSPNWTLFGLSGIACFTPRLAACFQVMGDMTFPDAAQFFPKRYDDPEWRCPELIVSWARNLQGSQCADHYFSGHYVIDMMKRGAKLIVVDPYNGWEAGRAELWLRVRPGADGALALGMIKVIVEENLYDKEFVEKWTFGFDKLKAEVAKQTLDEISQITWVPKDKIISAARMYAAAKPAAMRFGQPIDSNAEAVATIHGLASLWALTGNIDNPGGNVISRPPHGVTVYPYSTEEVIQLYGQEFVDKMNQKRIGADKYPLVKNFRSWAMSDDVLEQIETGKPYPIRGLWCQTNNFIAGTAQDPRRHLAAVSKLDFNVVVDTFMTPTAQLIADIVLPAGAITEKDSAFTTGVPCNPIYKVAQTEEARMDWEINFELAKRLNPQAVPWPNVRALFDQRLSITGHSFDSLVKAGYCMAPKGDATTPYYRHEKGLLRPDGKPGFRTPSGKFEFYSQKFEEYGLNPLPHHVEPIESEIGTPEIHKEYPLIMITGRRVGVMFHSEHRMIPWLREINPNPPIEIHPETAAKHGIKDGDWVWVEGTLGKAKRKATITPLTHPGIVLCQHGWWIPEAEYKGDGNPYKVWDINVNQLIPMGKNSKSGFGGAFTKTMLCRISKVKEGEEVTYV